MPVILNADNGAVSGISGLTTSADNSGVLQFQSSGTATLEISTTGNITIPGTGKRILGDFSNATLANRVAFQTSTTNGNTALWALPNGTGTSSNIAAFNNSDPTNASNVQIRVGNSTADILAGITGTGTFLPLTMYTGGSERLRIDTSGKLGVGVSSVNSGFFAQFNGSIGLGSPTRNQATTSLIGVRTSNDPADDSRCSITFGTTAGSVSSDSFISFATNQYGVSGGERMRIDSSGNVAIGTSSAFGRLTVDATGFSPLLTALTIGDLTTATNAVGIYLRSSGTSPAFITTAGAPLAFSANSTGSPELMRISPGGALVLSGGNTSATGVGITFPATQVASSNPNTLDDYEEGTFSPTVQTGITSPTYSRQTGSYIKIGKMVQFQISIETSSGTRNGSNLSLGSLPFVIGSFLGGPGFSFGYVNSVINSTTTNLPTAYGDSGQTYFSFYKTDSATFVGNDLQSGNFRMDITGTYITSN